jgi:hypothetical protein
MTSGESPRTAYEKLYLPRGDDPPVTPPSMGESLPHCPLAGAEPRVGACGAEYVSSWL